MSSLLETDIRNKSFQTPQSKEQIIHFTPNEVKCNERDIAAELQRGIYDVIQNYRIIFRERNLPQITEALPSPVYTPNELKDILTKIQAAFGVSTRDLADILRVQRQTIYAWNREENTPNEQNIARLQELDRKADDWNKLSPYPAKSFIKAKIYDEKSLFDLLTDDFLDHRKITTAMPEVAKRVNDYFERLNQRATKTSGSRSKLLPVSEYDLLALESVVLPEDE